MTRHIPDELARDDWSTLVMHYLGLDHIGHKAGPKRYGTSRVHLLLQLN